MIKPEVKAILKLLSHDLERAGFSRSASGILTRAVGPGVLSWVGLNVAKRGSSVEVNPVVGVRHQGIERLVAELTEGGDDGITPATVGANLGYLGAERRYQCYLFEVGSPAEETAAACVKQIDDVASRFAHENANLQNIIDTLKTPGKSIAEQSAYRLPVALLLVGEPVAAIEAVQRKVAQIGTRTDPAAVLFRSFAERLSQRTLERGTI